MRVLHFYPATSRGPVSLEGPITCRATLTPHRHKTSGRPPEDLSLIHISETIRGGKGKMPAFKSRLTGEQIAQLIDYIRSKK